MKIRQGFVSNSSTTSFMLYGKAFEPDDIQKHFNFIELKRNLIWQSNKRLSNERLLERIREKIKEELALFESAMEWNDLADYLDNVYKGDLFELIFADTDINIYQEPYDDYMYVGVSPTKMRDEQTLGEWKNEVKEKFRNSGLKEDISLGWIENAWRDW